MSWISAGELYALIAEQQAAKSFAQEWSNILSQGSSIIIGSYESNNDIESNYYNPNPDSVTYSFSSPTLTTEIGTPIYRVYGRCKVAGNIIRNNDYENESYIQLIVAHSIGPIQEFGVGTNAPSAVTDYMWPGLIVNDEKYENFITGEHSYLVHTGTTKQDNIDYVFQEKTTNFRGVAVSEFNFVKGTEIDSIDNINVIGHFLKCTPIGYDATEEGAWSRNPADVLWDWYINVENYQVSELNTNAFLSLQEYCNGKPSNAEQIKLMPICVNSTNVTATTEYYNVRAGGWRFKPHYAFDDSLSLTGSAEDVCWLSQTGSPSQQALHFDMGCAYYPSMLLLENYHSYGLSTDIGIYQFVVQGTNDIDVFLGSDKSGLTYEGQAGWTIVGGSSGSSLTALQHINADIIYPQEFTLDDTTAYRFYRLKIQNNWGDSSHMGVRQITLYGYSPRYTFDYCFDSDLSINDAKKLIWKSFNGISLMSQNTIKPLWDGAEEPDGAGSLQTKDVAHAFTLDNIVKDSFSWSVTEPKNVVQVTFKDAHNNYQETTVEFRDEKSITELGEKVLSQECYFITEKDVATRRCRFLFDKIRYGDYKCKFTAFMDAQHLEVYDRVTVTYEPAGWDEKNFIVTSKSEDLYGRCSFELLAYYSDVYHDKGYIDQPNYRSKRATIGSIPSGVTSLVLVNASYVDTANGNWISGATLTYETPKSYTFSHCIINLQTSDLDGSNKTNFYKYGIDNSRGEGFLISGVNGLFDYTKSVTAQVIAVNTAGKHSSVSPLVNINFSIPIISEQINNLPDEGGTIILPKGVYSFSGKTLPDKDITIKGITKGGVTINLSTGVTSHFRFIDYTKNFEISDINLITGSTKGCSHTASTGSTSNVFLSKNTGSTGKITLSNIKYTGVSAYYNEFLDTNNLAHQQTDRLIRVYGTNINIEINNSIIDYDSPISLYQLDSLSVYNCNFNYNLDNTITQTLCSETNIYNNTLYNCLGSTIYNSGTISSNHNISNNNIIISGVSPNRDNLNFPCIFQGVSGGKSIVESNTITISGTSCAGISGILLYGVNSQVINNNITIQGNFKTDDLKGIVAFFGSNDNIICSNYIFGTIRNTNRSKYFYGISLEFNSLRNIIASNTIISPHNNATYDIGVSIESGCNNNYGDGNITYNVGLSVDDNGTGNNVTAQDV